MKIVDSRQIISDFERLPFPVTTAEPDGISFSVHAGLNDQASLILYEKGTENVLEEIPFPAQPYYGNVRTMKIRGLNPAKTEYNFRVNNVVIQDPFSSLIIGRKPFGSTAGRTEHQIRCGVVCCRENWDVPGGPLRIPYENVVSYLLHVRGFTMQKQSKVRHRGTFCGLQEKIPYLKELGVNQVILMPAYEFDEVVRTVPRGAAGFSVPAKDDPENTKINYWGYTKGYYFAPKYSYCSSERPDDEVRSMVRSFHENGMEVVMEFAFADDIPIDYMHACLCWWVYAYHIDGFLLMARPAAVQVIAGSALLTGIKLMSDYFDCAQIANPKLEGIFFKPLNVSADSRHLADCNNSFRESARRILKGDEGQLYSFVEKTRRNGKEKGVINYITSHDGFTLSDLVSYDSKHNEANGENNRDGADCEYSWNCGAEGPTKKRLIQRIRLRQMKNAFAMMLLAQGTPMLLAGDEMGNSQNGNNNPWCQDNEISWTDWKGQKNYQELTSFVKELIAFRKEHAILHMPGELTGQDLLGCGYPDISVHSERAWYAEYEYQSRHVGILYCGKHASQNEFLYVAYNFHWEEQKLALPNLPEGLKWTVAINTYSGQAADENDRPGILPCAAESDKVQPALAETEGLEAVLTKSSRTETTALQEEKTEKAPGPDLKPAVSEAGADKSARKSEGKASRSGKGSGSDAGMAEGSVVREIVIPGRTVLVLLSVPV